MNGYQDEDRFVYLQVRGKNQLLKEIEETRDLGTKIIDDQALHRNEITKEIEGEGLNSS